MKCLFFGHTFGHVAFDGFQYCKSCGKATKPSVPHPCENGHIYGKLDETGVQSCTVCNHINKPTQQHPCRNFHTWRDTGEPDCVVTSNYGQWKDYYVAQKCSICGERRSVKKY